MGGRRFGKWKSPSNSAIFLTKSCCGTLAAPGDRKHLPLWVDRAETFNSISSTSLRTGIKPTPAFVLPACFWNNHSSPTTSLQDSEHSLGDLRVRCMLLVYNKQL